MLNFLQGIDPQLLAMGMNMPNLQGPAQMPQGLLPNTNPMDIPMMNQSFGLLGQMPNLNHMTAMIDPSMLAINEREPEKKRLQGFPFSQQPQQQRSMVPGGGLGRMNPMGQMQFLPMANLRRR